MRLKIVKARDLKTSMAVRAISTYANINFKDQVYQTGTTKAGGTNPVWKASKFKVKFDEPTQEFTLRVWKENMVE